MEKRNSSVDLLRNVAMFMVVILHVVCASGLVEMPYDQNPTAKWMSYSWEAPTIIAVNVFAMLSGYLCVDKKWQMKRFFALWAQMLFYAFPCAVGAYWIGKMATVGEILTACFPLTCRYWYFAAYSALFVLMPFINKGLLALSKRDCFLLCTLSVTTFSFFGFSATDELAGTGHCALWLIVMYICGAYVKLHGILPASVPEKYMIHVRFMCLFIFLLCCVAGCIVLRISGETESLLFRNYQSPIVCIESLVFFVMLINLPIRSVLCARVLQFLSPMAFGVYLFHYALWRYMVKGIPGIGEATQYAWWFIPVTGILIYALAIGVDYLRLKLFLLLRVPDMCRFLASKMPSALRRMEEW